MRGSIAGVTDMRVLASICARAARSDKIICGRIDPILAVDGEADGEGREARDVVAPGRVPGVGVSKQGCEVQSGSHFHGQFGAGFIRLLTGGAGE